MLGIYVVSRYVLLHLGEPENTGELMNHAD